MNKLKVGVIGCGHWGPHLLRNFASCPLTVPTTVCDPNPARLEAMDRKYSHLGLVRTVDELLEQDVEAVAIATPVATHFTLAQRCLEAGRHVLVEKPMAASAAEAAALNDLAARQGLVLMVDHTYLFSSAVRQIKRQIDQGELGDIQYLDSIRINLGKFQRDINVIWDLAVHDLSIADYIFGSRVSGISAWGRANVEPAVEDIAYVNVDYGSRCLAHFHVNWLSPVKVRRMTFGGSDRTLVFDDLREEPLQIYEHGPHRRARNGDRVRSRNLSVASETRSARSPAVGKQEPLQAVVRHFAECVREERQPLSDGAMGLRIVRLLEAADRSLQDRGGRIVVGQADLENFALPRGRGHNARVPPRAPINPHLHGALASQVFSA